METRRRSVYIETTMFNYYFDEARDAHPAVAALFEAVGRGEYNGYTSAITLDELNAAPEPRRTKMRGLIEKYHIVVLDDTDEAKRLADIYVNNGIIPVKKRLDARHIAIAVLNNIDIIFSLNFKHINKLKTKMMIPLISQIEGYRSIIIATPQEVFEDE